MDFIIISAVAMAASLLTLFSGFGLGTLLMPIVALFFPIEIAVTITAIVHFANNAFKVLLVGSKVNIPVLVKFGVPAVIFSFIGALLLTNLSNTQSIIQYSLLSYEFSVSLVNLIVGLLILLLVGVELLPFFANLAINKKYLPFGGVLSGFLGGLSGHQGAFRSMFLLKAGLSKEQFVATGVILAVMVDVSRLSIYGWHFSDTSNSVNWLLVASACISAFIGAYFGKKLLTKITITTIQKLVSLLLIIIGLCLITGVI